MKQLRRLVRCVRSSLFSAACIGSLAFTCSVAMACDCEVPDLEQGLADSEIVFSGEVVEILRRGSARDVRIHVDAVWKGPVIDEVIVRTADNEGECGFPFSRGGRFIVYGRSLERFVPGCELVRLGTNTDICTRTKEYREEEAAALGEPLWAAPKEVFRRGDVDDDGVLGLSDMIRILDFLFRAGEPGRCEDAMDTNDDGSVDLSDGVFGLSYLFVGGPEPPAPGPQTPGYDGTPDDPFDCGDGRALACESRSRSSLPGVRLDIVDAPCVLTLAEAAAGVTFTYRLVVDHGWDVTSGELGNCRRGDPGRLRLYGLIHGGPERYCLCDLGKCIPEEHRTDLAIGSQHSVFRWCGRNWFGPSDFFNPIGDPFPPGMYTFQVRGIGTRHDPDDGGATEFELVAEYEFELVE